LRYGGRF